MTMSKVSDAPDPIENNASTNDKEKPLPQVSIFKLFSYANALDILIMVIGSVAAGATGLLMVAFWVVFGDTMDVLNEVGTDSFKNKVNELALVFLYLGIINVGTATMQVLCFTFTGGRQAQRVKNLYVKAILRQDIGWFETNSASELATRVNIASFEFEDGISRKFGDVVCFTIQFFGCFVYAFYSNWKISLVILASFPVMGVAGWLLSEWTAKGEKIEADNYARAGFIATEVVSAIRTVASLNGEKREIERYDGCLDKAKAVGIKKKSIVGFLTGLMFGLENLTYALGFWFGLKLAADGVARGCSYECEVGLVEDGCPDNCVSGGTVLIVLFAILTGSYSIAQLTPGMTALAAARTAAASIFETLNRVPPIDTASSEGQKLSIKGEIDFQHINFCYPTRPDNQVCNDYTLSIKPGETVALVGPSGSGKSTFMRLLLRFYDPQSGSVRVDGQDIRSLNLKHYRSQIGYVRQEPVLFSGSIRENILHGKSDASFEEVQDAAKQANAHDFIMTFPDTYDTQVGDSGTQLSGGQKQRIAIARALINDPPILLLDEATSALDKESELVVQQALDKLREDSNRTTVIIAHRLSTIKDADKIAVIDGGKVVEMGSHEKLLSSKGLYSDLYSVHDSEMLEERPSQSKEMIVSEGSISLSAERGRMQSFSKEEDADEEAPMEDKKQVAVARIMGMMRPDSIFLVLGIFGGIMAGGVLPVTGVIMVQNIGLFYRYDEDEMRKEAAFWSVAFVIVALVCWLGYTILFSALGVVGERLTKRLRSEAFTSIVRHEITWFDRDENSPGNLATSLSEDCKKVHTAFGEQWGMQVQVFSTMGVGIALGFYFSWRMALVTLAVTPLNIAAGAILMASMTGQGYEKEDSNKTPAGAILSMAVNAMGTVTAFNLQDAVCDRYAEAEDKSRNKRVIRSIIGGAALGLSGTMMFWSFALMFWYMRILIEKDQNTFKEAMSAVMGLLYSAFGAGQAASAAGDQKSAAIAAKKIFTIIDEVEDLEIDSFSTTGAIPSKLSGSIEFIGVHFAYPSRPDIPIYGGPGCPKGYNLTVKPGQTVALVGPSGSGKSTAMSLLLRFYTPQRGQILLDGKDVRDLNIQWLRNQLGYVGQEPVLFADTIRNNIAYGKPSTPDSAIIAAAKAANAHEFIDEFQDKYDTDVGEKSALLSGGQKQRVAIARAIIREPSILLLDEATSALDNESEKVVQEALDKLRKNSNRTTLVIAHRLTTIQDSDVIAVVKDGGIVESGTHGELLEMNGFYAELSQI